MAAPEIPQKMKAVQLVEIKKPYEIRDVDVPINLDPPGKYTRSKKENNERGSNSL